MSKTSSPRDYPTWRPDPIDRAEDAAYTFGYYLMLHCRDQAMAKVPADCDATTKQLVENAVDTALHNVCDMLEGFWRLDSGTDYSVSLKLGVQVHDTTNEIIETVDISPCRVDLPIGYWKWAKDRDFR